MRLEMILTNRERSDYLRSKLRDNEKNMYEAFSELEKERIKLYEGLILSIAQDHMSELLSKKNITHTKYRKVIHITEPLDHNTAISLQQILDVGGWYVSYPKDVADDKWKLSKNYKRIGSEIDFLTIEAKYDTPFEPETMPKFLFHVAPMRSRESIIANGLIPKARNKKSNHPERIYFSISKEGAFEIRDIFVGMYKEEFDIWYIKTESHKNRKWFLDPNYLGDDGDAYGIYTVEPINRYRIYLA